jgi:hypothetical protein
MKLTIDKNNDKISNTQFVWDDQKMVYKLSFDYTFACNCGLTVHYAMTIHDVSLWHNPTDGHSFLIWNDIDVFEFDDEDTIFEEELDDSERDMLFDEKSDVCYAQSYDNYADDMMKDFLENGVDDDIIFNIVDFYGYDPNHKVSFFKKMLAKMGWTFRETDMVKTVVTSEEQSRQD